MTYQEISDKYNISIKVLNRRVFALQLKGLYVGRKISFSKGQVFQLINYKPKAYFDRKKAKEDWKYQNKKITIIEFYIKHRSARKVSHILNIHRKICDYTVKEFNELGSITVASRMNKEEFEF